MPSPPDAAIERWCQFVRDALTEAGYPGSEVWWEDDGMWVEHCGDCDCPNGGRDDDCGPPERMVDKAYDLLNQFVERENGSRERHADPSLNGSPGERA